MSNDEAWPVLPHGPIEKLTENLWRVEGELPQFSMKRVMTIARRSDGDLVIHSAIALEQDAMAAIEAFGRPAFLLIPHVRHRLDAPRFKKRYPAIRVLATKGARTKAEEVVHVEGTYEDFPPDRDVSLRMLRGVKDAEGAMIVRSDDGVTVVLNEVVFDIGERPTFFGRMFLRAARVGPGPRVTPFVKFELVRDKKALRDDLCQLAETPDLTRLIVSHERMSSGPSARTVLRKAAGYL